MKQKIAIPFRSTAPLLVLLFLVSACDPVTKYTLNISVQGEGTTTPAAGEYKYDSGSEVTITPSPLAGWRFSHWEGDVSGSAVPALITISAAMNVTAVFVEDPWEEDSFTYDVELAPEVTVIQDQDLDLLLEVDPDTWECRFDAAGVLARGLDVSVGRILMIESLGFQRIVAVETVGEELVVQTDYATMTEAIQNGTVAWDYGVEFDADHIESFEVKGYGEILLKDNTPIEVEMKIGEYIYRIKATLDNITSTFEFGVSKDLPGPAGAELKASGVINRFRSRDQIDIAEGALQEFDHELTGMRGEATLELIVAATGNDFINLEFPVTLMRVPFMVGIIPVVLNIRIQFVINASVPLDGSARVTSKFTYDSDLGFSYAGTGVQAGGRLGPLEFGDALHETGASSAISANFGVGFPRVELSIAGDSVVPWAQTAFLVGGSYTMFPACQTADAQFIGAAGFDLGLFGLNLVSGSKTLFSEKKELLRAGECDKLYNDYGLEVLFTEMPLDTEI